MRKLLTALIFTVVSHMAVADWQLNNEASSLSFLSTKKNAITEVHSFKQLRGSISDDGKANISIALASVETNIAIRNQRMQELLFEVAEFQTAMASLSIEPKLIADLQLGELLSLKSKGTLNLHGSTKELPVDLVITRLRNNTLQVHTLRPLVLNAADFELTSGIEALRTVAKLSSINTAVPVVFTLIFEKQD